MTRERDRATEKETENIWSESPVEPDASVELTTDR